MDDAGGVDVLESALCRGRRSGGRQRGEGECWTNENLVEKVLDELLLEGTGGEESMEVRSEKLGDKVDILEGRNEDVGEGDDVFVLNVLEELEFAIGTLGEDWGT